MNETVLTFGSFIANMIVGILASLGMLVIIMLIWDTWIRPRVDTYKENRGYKFAIGDIVKVSIPNGETRICKIWTHKYDKHDGRVYRVLQIKDEGFIDDWQSMEFEEEIISAIRWD